MRQKCQLVRALEENYQTVCAIKVGMDATLAERQIRRPLLGVSAIKLSLLCFLLLCYIDLFIVTYFYLYTSFYLY